MSNKQPFTYKEFLADYIGLKHSSLIKHFKDNRHLTEYLEGFTRDTGCIIPWNCYSKEDFESILEVVYKNTPFELDKFMTNLEEDKDEVQESIYRILKQDRKVDLDQSEVKAWLEEFRKELKTCQQH